MSVEKLLNKNYSFFIDHMLLKLKLRIRANLNPKFYKIGASYLIV